MKVECQECLHTFSCYYFAAQVECPECGSEDLDIAESDEED